MRRVTPLVAAFVAAIFAISSTAIAGPVRESPPPIDWRDFVDDMSDGDHVVGEEMCARPQSFGRMENHR
jgi:hypothetical protein